MTNNMARSDRLVGTYIVGAVGTTNLPITVEVESDPCPQVQWSFNGTSISSTDPMYTFDQPCDDQSAQSPYTFQLTIANLTSANSGEYSATFDNGHNQPTPLPDLFVTVPGTYSGNVFWN